MKIFETNIDVRRYLKCIGENLTDWDRINDIPGVQGKRDVTGCIPLALGIKKNVSDDIDDVDEIKITPFYKTYDVLVQAARDRGFADHARMGIFRLVEDGHNGIHTETGKYYETKNRYHLSLTGRYELTVDGVSYVIEPGTFFWFDNSLPHEAKNLGPEVRYALVFDADKTIPYNFNGIIWNSPV